jgi:hypothetical protein
MLKKLQTYYLLIAFCMLMGLQACDKALFDSGPETSKEVIINEPFTSINFKNIFDVTMVQDTVNKVIFTCGENLLPKVSAEVINQQLTFDHTEKDNWSREYKHIKAEVHVTTSPTIHVNAPINLRNADTLKGNTFWLCDYGKFSDINVTVNVKSCSVFMTSDNFGTFTVKGKAGNANLWGWGSAVVHADSLISQTCLVKHRGFGDVYVNVLNQLNVSLEFTGNVYCVTNPTKVVIEKKTSSGELLFK